MKNTNTRQFKVVLKMLKSIQKENLNELKPADLAKIQKCITLIEQGALESRDRVQLDVVIFQVLGLLDRVARNLPAIAAILQKLGE